MKSIQNDTQLLGIHSKRFVLLVAACALVGLSGCASVQMSSEGADALPAKECKVGLVKVGSIDSGLRNSKQRKQLDSMDRAEALMALNRYQRSLPASMANDPNSLVERAIRSCD